MKKTILSLIACLAFAQTTYAARPPLFESIEEYNTITESLELNGKFFGLIPESDFIVDIQRKTKEVDIQGIVHYFLVTRTADKSALNAFVAEDFHEHHCSNPKKQRRSFNKYLVTLQITNNTQIGPNIVEVKSIKKISDHKLSRDIDLPVGN